jgi:glycosyltransferase involved in cell wall biosynthesis
LKIVYYNTTGTLGGAELCLLDILATLRAARPQWRLSVLLGDDGPLRAEAEALDVPCTLLPLPRNVVRLGDAGLVGRGRGGVSGLRLAARSPGAAMATAAYLRRLRRALRAAAPDRIQTSSMKAHVLGAWGAPRGVPVVWHLHDYVGQRPVMARLLRWSARRSVAAVAVSHSVAADAARMLGPRVPVHTIVNAIDLARFAPGPGDGAALDAAAGLPAAPPGTVRVGLVATFARWKGHDVFLEAIARIAADRPCRFYIVGGPIYQSLGSQYTLEELKDRAAALGLDNRVGFVGYQANPAAALRALDVVVHASTRPEPFGRVIVEGMACARAVVAAGHGGAAELFENGVSALGCAPGDPGALANVITRLVADRELRHRLGAAGRQTALDRYDRKRLAEEWVACYTNSLYTYI